MPALHDASYLNAIPEPAAPDVERLRTANARQRTMIEDFERDLTEARQANDALRETVERLEARLRDAPREAPEIPRIADRERRRREFAEDALLGLAYHLGLRERDALLDAAMETPDPKEPPHA